MPLSHPLPAEMSSAPRLDAPQSIFDLLNFRVSEFYGVSGALVTRMCEGEFGITREEWQFIAMLAAVGAMSPSELAGRTTVDRSQGSRTLRQLVDKKLVTRAQVPGDGRRAEVSLSSAGHALYVMVFPRVVMVHQALLQDLDAAEIAALSQCLQKIQEAASRVARSGLIDVHADRRHGGSRSTWRADTARR